MHCFRNFIVVVALVFTACFNVRADDNAKRQAKQPKFELRDGDRVVFLGNTLIERAQKYGYWETMLTARYPNKKITFRNLGWSGDTVWAESRGMFDPPAVGYKRMIEHVGRLKPTVIFVGYGNNEAFAGKEGLPAFIEQYNKLLDDLTRVSAKGVRFVLITSYLYEKKPAPLPDQTEQNKLIRLYANAIKDIGKIRGVVVINFISVCERIIGGKTSRRCWPYTSNGISFTQTMWNYTGHMIRLRSQDPGRRFNSLILHTDGRIVESSGVVASNIKKIDGGIQFQVLPKIVSQNGDSLTVRDLPLGKYEIRIDGKEKRNPPNSFFKDFESSRHFSDNKRTKVVNSLLAFLRSPTDDKEFDKLRQAIIAKNQLYFYRWRPQNITYLFGFRKHEQGQNAKELAQFDKLIAAKEAEINKLKKPVAHTYEIIRVKEKPKLKPKQKPAKP